MDWKAVVSRGRRSGVLALVGSALCLAGLVYDYRHSGGFYGWMLGACVGLAIAGVVLLALAYAESRPLRMPRDD
jgi:hypothetical protein